MGNNRGRSYCGMAHTANREAPIGWQNADSAHDRASGELSVSTCATMRSKLLPAGFPPVALPTAIQRTRRDARLRGFC